MALLECGGGVGEVVAGTVASMLSQDVQEQIKTCRHATVRYEPFLAAEHRLATWMNTQLLVA